MNILNLRQQRAKLFVKNYFLTDTYSYELYVIRLIWNQQFIIYFKFMTKMGEKRVISIKYKT